MQRTIRYCSLVIAMGMVAGETPRAWAVPYASGVRTTTGSMREFVLNGASPTEIKREAVRGGMTTLRRSALNKVLEGVTTLGEVYYVSAADG